MHKVTFRTVYPDELGSIRTLDYNQRTVANVPFESLGVSGEPEIHKFNVRDSIRKEGVKTPLLSFARKDELPLLIEGHHRAIVAYADRLPVTVEEHACRCSAVTLDYFGLCPILLESARRQK